eukprot:60048_1
MSRQIARLTRLARRTSRKLWTIPVALTLSVSTVAFATAESQTKHRNSKERRNMNGKKARKRKRKPKPNDAADKKEAVDINSDEEEWCYSYNHGGCNKRQCDDVHKRYVDVLRECSNIYYKSEDVNVKNLGIYLKNTLDGYDKLDDRENPGYIKYGTYARTFCKIVCVYMLGEFSFLV